MAVKNVRHTPLPQPPSEYSREHLFQMIRTLELYFNQLDSFAPNQAESYMADWFFGGAYYESNEVFSATGSPATTTGVVLADVSGGGYTLNLPAAADSTGRVITFKKTDNSGNTLTIDGNGSETIDGATTAAITTAFGSLRLYCDGTEWWTI